VKHLLELTTVVSRGGHSLRLLELRATNPEDTYLTLTKGGDQAMSMTFPEAASGRVAVPPWPRSSPTAFNGLAKPGSSSYGTKEMRL